MDDVHQQAQERGYNDGSKNRHQTDYKKSYSNYSSLANAYDRGHKQGYDDYKKSFSLGHPNEQQN
jgi:hypothetical protein